MRKRVLIIALALCLLFVAFPFPEMETAAKQLTSESIRDKENQISEAEKEKEALESGLTDLQKVKRELEKKKKDLKDYVAQLDGELVVIEQKISELKIQIADKEEDILRTGEELEAALALEESQKEYMIARIRMMYERGSFSVLDVLLKADGLGNFLNRADFVESVMAYDHQRWEEYQEIRQLIALSMEALELEKDILDQAKASVEIEQGNLESLIQQKNEDITAYESDINIPDGKQAIYITYRGHDTPSLKSFELICG